MQTHKKNLKNLIIDTIESNFPDIKESLREKISTLVAEKTVEHNTLTHKSFNNDYQELVLNYENNRAFITEYMNMLRYHSEALIKTYKEKRFVSIEYDVKKGCNQMKYKTEVLKDTCVFMNKINEIVAKYSIEVMKMKPDNKSQEQIALF
jgi:hypothetical protein